VRVIPSPPAACLPAGRRSEESAFRESQRKKQISLAKTALEMTSWGVFQQPASLARGRAWNRKLLFSQFAI
jgi:hypothetical protein